MKKIYFKYNNNEFQKLQDILLSLGCEWAFSKKEKLISGDMFDCITLYSDLILVLKNSKQINSGVIYDINKENIKDIEVYVNSMKMGLL